MRRKPRPNKQIVAFKVEPELAALLDAMPNKSEFIRNAVATAALDRVPPLSRDRASRRTAASATS